MALRISGKNMDVGESLRGSAQTRFDTAIRKYFDGGYSGHLTLEPEGSGYSALCLVHLDTGAILQSTAFGKDAIGAYEAMAETIEKRLRRYNQRLKARRRHVNDAEVLGERSSASPVEEPDDAGGDLAPPVIAETAAGLRQMSVGEAVMELDHTQAEVVMFRHAGHGGLNVVYRRADGNIGWIDAASRAN
jgi:ribosomal subunit interface protein